VGVDVDVGVVGGAVVAVDVDRVAGVAGVVGGVVGVVAGAVAGVVGSVVVVGVVG
jgi:hypothetical protein